MNIGISVVTYFPDENGVQFVTQNLAEGLAEKGHTVFVLTSMRNNLDVETVVNGVNIIRCDIKDKNTFHYGNKLDFQDKITQLSKKVDVMVFVRLQSVSVDWALDILDYIDCEKILYLHGIHEFKWKMSDISSLKNFLLKVFRDLRWASFYAVNKKRIGKFDKIIHLHEKDNSYTYFKKIYPGKNYILENFVEKLFLEPYERVQNQSDYYIYIANYYPGKNQMLLLNAFYLMKSDFKLIFIGGGRNEKYYNKLLEKKRKLDKKYGITKDIIFLKNISRKKLIEYLRNSYAFVMTSKSEHYPIALMEAMSVGLPVISTNVGIVKYLPGCLIVKNNVVDIANKLDFLLQNKRRYQTLKEKARIYAQNNFDFSKYYLKFEEIICAEN